MRKSHVLVVDDEELYRRALERILIRVGHDVLMARDATEAMGIVSSHPVDLVLCDIKMPGINGLELVRQIHEVEPDLPCIVITGYSTAENSIEALRAGAFWYLEKPFEQERLDVIRRLVDQAIEHGRLKVENRALHSQLQSRYKFDNIVGKSQALQRVLSVVEKVADTDSTVLITGESGTGKELIARALHYNSSRANRMMVTVNCGAIPEELLESELFGHVKGAFTNAVNHREGRFALADGGTIFLDEIGDMSPNLQVKLLRVLQERTFEPVGSSKTVKVNVRVIAATNQHLEELIEQKKFREDLYYRLNVLPIESPPLRDRADDIPLLIHHFIDIGNQQRNMKINGISEEAMKLLVHYRWPGNVRELENMVERVMILRETGDILGEDLPPQFHSQQTGANRASDGNERQSLAPVISSDGISFNDVIGDLETDLILQALEQTHWNKNRAAQLLGLNRTTLLEKIKKKGLEPRSS
ncbi:MAG TPA: sigma-54-dependent Fis family transcriptional regulator [Myxococcales bacterium]|nr:sigma-54-dependent Fis family transcriptional regulator [Myxococcales bacterium]HIM01301.1 sigma-54-dependent Fis family transcriptional regulator [Myxococcales bacterium]